MKGIRIIVIVVLVVALLGVTVYWSRQPGGFATPADCLDAYREACRAGDLQKYWSCLAEPLRAGIQQQHPSVEELASFLRRDMTGLKSWVAQLASESEHSKVQVDVDEVRAEGNRRIRFLLERSRRGWLIVGLDEPKPVPAHIPFGTHISKVPAEAQP